MQNSLFVRVNAHKMLCNSECTIQKNECAFTFSINIAEKLRKNIVIFVAKIQKRCILKIWLKSSASGEMADASDLGSGEVTRGGSRPPLRTNSYCLGARMVSIR